MCGRHGPSLQECISEESKNSCSQVPLLEVEPNSKYMLGSRNRINRTSKKLLFILVRELRVFSSVKISDFVLKFPPKDLEEIATI